MRTILSMLYLIPLLMLGACGGQYWVTGLTLPSGSTIVSKSETTLGKGAMPGNLPMALPGIGTADKMLMVSFNCSGGWAAVSGHIDRCMTGQGYADTMAGIQSMMGGAGAGGQGADAMAMLGSMRSYSKGGSKFTVMLMDMGAAMSAASKISGQSVPGGMPGMGQYSLMVMKAK